MRVSPLFLALLHIPLYQSFEAGSLGLMCSGLLRDFDCFFGTAIVSWLEVAHFSQVFRASYSIRRCLVGQDGIRSLLTRCSAWLVRHKMFLSVVDDGLGE